MSGESHHAIKPTEIADVMAAIQAETGCKVLVTWEVHSSSESGTRLLVSVALEGHLSPVTTLQKWTASQAWPCNTHKTILGLLYNLLISAQQQYDASTALDALQASP